MVASTTAAPAPTPKESAAANLASSLANGENGGGSNSRLANTTACLPFIYGSVAFFQGKKADEYHTHKWTLYLRGANDEDLSGCISKVIFQLHPSFSQPVRELTEQPFEVTERGWGEFEAQIRIIWKDPQEKATVMNHGLKLYPPGSTNMQPTKEPVVAEVYDEAVFTDPKEFFFQSLMQVADLPKVQFADPAIQACFQSFSDEDDFQRLLEAQKFLTKELNQVKARMKSATMEMEQVDNELSQVHEAKKAAASGSRAQKHKTAPSAGNASKKSKSS